MKIDKQNCILVGSDIIPQDDEGGSGTVAWEVCKILTKKGNKVVVLTRGKLKSTEKETIDNIEIYRYKNNIIKCKKIFYQLQQSYKFNSILLHHPFTSIGILTSKIKDNTAIIYFFYSPWPEEYSIRSADLNIGHIKQKLGVLFRKYIEKKVLSKANKIIVLSQFMKQKLQYLYNIQDNKITIISGGINLERFKPITVRKKLRKKLNLPENRYILLTIRNLVSRMGIDNLILAMNDLVRNYPDIYLVIGGRGYLEKKLKNLVSKLGLEKWITFVGYIPDDILPEYYQTADLFVLPTSKLEGFGLVTLESMSCGTPVLATPVGGTVEILKKFDKHFLFKGINSEDMVEGIEKFLKQKDIHSNLRERCRRFVEDNYSWDKFSNTLEEIIYQTLKDTKSGR